ncbi:Calcium uniporter protein 1, mitochondrial-like protein [Drosera capensis]
MAASKKILSHRFFSISRFIKPILAHKNPVRLPLRECLMSSDPGKGPAMDPDPGNSRLMQWRNLYQSAAAATNNPAIVGTLPRGERLMERLREIGIGKQRIVLDGLSPMLLSKKREEEENDGGLSIGDVKKVLRVERIERLKAKLRDWGKDWVDYSEFVRICSKESEEDGLVYAKMLDESGAVIVLGNSVCLRPDQGRLRRAEVEGCLHLGLCDWDTCDHFSFGVIKAVRKLIPLPLTNPDDPRIKELEEMEEWKDEIDQKAESLVRRELWCGLGYLLVQTAVFMRLTFWELSWDVMEPICFYLTSAYFMAGYTFFLRTSKEPSFEGFFKSRFASKQKRLFEEQNFDIQRYNELRRAFHPYSLSSSEEQKSFSAPFGCCGRTRFDQASCQPCNC